MTTTSPPRKKGLRGLIACRNYPIVYVNMPKSACTTCKNILYRVDTGEGYPDPLAIHADSSCLLQYRDDNQEPEKALEALEKVFARRKICFTFVREPFSRSYSAFNEKIVHASKYSFPRVKDTIAAHFGAKFGLPEAEISREQHATNFAAFLKFIRLNIAGKTPRFASNPHWAPQADVLAWHRRGYSVDLVGRVEKFELGMRYALDMAGYEGDVDLSVRFNEGPKPPYRLSEIMNEQIHSLLHEIYDGDLAEFGYRCPHCGEQSLSKSGKGAGAAKAQLKAVAA